MLLLSASAEDVIFRRAPFHRKVVGLTLLEEVESKGNPSHGKMDCKAEAHVNSEHVLCTSFQQEMTAPVSAGAVLRKATPVFSLAEPIAHL